MKHIAIYMRFFQLFAHNAHNYASKQTFFSDHEFFGELYGMAEGFYDSIVERMIGIEEEFDPAQAQLKAAQFLSDLKMDLSDNDACFEACLGIAQEVTKELDAVCKSGKYSEGTRQMLGDIADKLEVVIYKLKRRLKG